MHARKQFDVHWQASSTSADLGAVTRERLAGVGHTGEAAPRADRAMGERQNAIGRQITGYQLERAHGMTGDSVELYPVPGGDDRSRLVCGPDAMEPAGI
ncbi:hypothetical protein AWC20_16690 [Mycobacterium parmense]|nr:hypothetical protein AWC20_16690 [Mycobacterium parmense]